MPIFTSIPARPNVTPSDLFKEYKNYTDMPCPIYETVIFANTTATCPALGPFRGNFQYHIAANVLQRQIPVEGFVNTSLPSATSYVALTPAPPVGLLVPGMNSPAQKQELYSLGFSEESIGSRKFYRGITELAGLPRIMQMNPVVDNGVPFGICNPQGLLAFFWISSLVYGGYASFPDRASAVRKPQYGITPIGDSYVVDPTTDRRMPVIIKAQKGVIPKGIKGHLFPYFDGLNLPDKTGPMRFLLSRIQNILGENPAAAAEASHHLSQGWKNLASTSAGMALSHIIFGLDLALQCGSIPCIIHSNESKYLGFVLMGGMVQVQKGSMTYEPTKTKDLETEVLNMNTHQAALESIAAIVNEYQYDPKDKDSEYYDMRPQLFTLPRQLHNILRKIKFKPEDSKVIFQELKRLDFPQEYWNPKDSLLIERVIRKLASGEFPENSWPIPYKSQVMFSSNQFQSVLSVFGSTVPTLSLTSGSPVALVKTKTKSTLTNKEGGKLVLPEVPIYIRPLEEATAAWQMVFNNHQLFVKYKRNREGIDGAAKALKPDSPNAQSLFMTLVTSLPEQSNLGKRKLGDSEVAAVKERQEKRQRTVLKSNLAQSNFLMSRLGLGGPVAGPSRTRDSAEVESEPEEQEVEENAEMAHEE